MPSKTRLRYKFGWRTAGITVSGDTLTVNGTGFGSGPENQVDLKTNIEAGAAGADFAATNWSLLYLTGEVPPKYSAVQKHSFNQSIVCSWPAAHGGDADSGICWDMGADRTEFYASWWVYFDNPATESAQWKHIRFGQSAAVSSVTPYLYEQMWYDIGGGSMGANYICNRIAPHAGDYPWCYYPNYRCSMGAYVDSEGNAIPRCALLNAADRVDIRAWNRMEVYVKMNSPAGTANGTLTINIHKPATTGITAIRNDVGNTMQIDTDTENQNGLRYLLWENYFGNRSGPPSDVYAYMDEIYTVYGDNSQARVEIGDSAAWAGCTQRILQPVQSWSNTEIVCSYRPGTISTKYAYVVHADGTVSDPIAVT